MSVWTSEEIRRLQPVDADPTDADIEDELEEEEPEDDDAYDRARDLAAEEW
jgi:hypothetical protein